MMPESPTLATPNRWPTSSNAATTAVVDPGGPSERAARYPSHKMPNARLVSGSLSASGDPVLSSEKLPTSALWQHLSIMYAGKSLGSMPYFHMPPTPSATPTADPSLHTKWASSPPVAFLESSGMALDPAHSCRFVFAGGWGMVGRLLGSLRTLKTSIGGSSRSTDTGGHLAGPAARKIPWPDRASAVILVSGFQMSAAAAPQLAPLATTNDGWTNSSPQKASTAVPPICGPNRCANPFGNRRTDTR
mmetsp:Transcript_5391/g.14865  ORF Transcript_5391/g.14865 Transcript_5391/m.14865 type:complete len:247 (+) Transcript_5391:1456-2196(+)